MFCRNCGANVEDGENFCSNCGTPVEIAEDDTQKLTNNAYYDTGVTKYTTQYNSGQQDIIPEKSKKYTSLLVILGVIIAGLAAAICFGVLQLIRLNEQDESYEAPLEVSSNKAEEKPKEKTNEKTNEKTKDTDHRQTFDGHQYEVIEDGKLTWTEAKADCESRGGYLTVITSAEEQAFAEELISTGKKDFYWLGGTDEDSMTNDFLWVTGEVFDYHNWAEGQPDDGDWGVGGRENYIGILRKDKYGASANTWNDFRDNPNDSRGYICEWNN